MTKETKDLTKTNANLPSAISQDVMDEWMDAGQVSSNDLVLAKVLAMQLTSELVKEQLAAFGDFRDSLTSELLGSVDPKVAANFEFIPFLMKKKWVIMHGREAKGQLKYEYQGQVEMTPANENLPWNEEIMVDKVPTKLRRDYTYDFYILNAKNLDEMPRVLSFRRTSAKAGKKLATIMYVENKQLKLSPASRTMFLTGSKETNDDGSFVVLDVAKSRATSPAELEKALYWFQMFKKSDVKVDDSDVKKETGYGQASQEASSTTISNAF